MSDALGSGSLLRAVPDRGSVQSSRAGTGADQNAESGRRPGWLIESRNLDVGGKKLKTRVWVGICAERKPGASTCHYDAATDAVDVGQYRYYAGPATTKKSAKGRCIAASGFLWIGGTRDAVSTQPWVGHCG